MPLCHLRKAELDDPIDLMQGTLGWAGGLDNVLILEKDAAGKTLFGVGRDLEEMKLRVRMGDNLRWESLGPAVEISGRGSPERDAVIRMLAKNGTMGLSAIHDELKAEAGHEARRGSHAAEQDAPRGLNRERDDRRVPAGHRAGRDGRHLMAHNHEQLAARILELSRSQDWYTAKREWSCTTAIVLMRTRSRRRVCAVTRR